MSTRFGIIIDLLIEAFRNFASEGDYYDIVNILRSYELSRDSSFLERTELEARGWPLDYDPCEHIENIRMCMAFGNDNLRIKELLDQYQSILR